MSSDGNETGTGIGTGDGDGLLPLLTVPSLTLKFHPNHCSGLTLSNDGSVATWRTRLNGNQRLVFSDRPIKRNEKVFVRVMENSILNEGQPDNQKKATFGFTTFDPAKLSTAAGQLELHTSVDVKGALMGEKLRKGAIYSFWLGDNGCTHRGSDCQQGGPVIEVNSLPLNLPVWFMVRTRGNITLKLVESDVVFMVTSDGGVGHSPITYIYPDLANAFAHIMKANATVNKERSERQNQVTEHEHGSRKTKTPA